MKKIVSGLLALSLGIIGAAQAKTYTNKTFLMPRDQLTDLAMQKTTWHKQINKKGDDKFGGSAQATLFYRESENRSSIGKYFGFEAPAGTFNDYILVEGLIGKNVNTEGLLNAFIYHYNSLQAPTDMPLHGILRLKPRQQVWGVRLDYFQDLDKLLNGLFFTISAPIVDVENTLGESVENEIKLATKNGFNPGNNSGKGIADFFKGNITQPAGANQQAALKYAKIDGKKSTTELADIQVMLGYNLVNKKDMHVGLNLALVIPTGTTPKGEYLFEPVGGNGDHWALGGGVDSKFTLWESKKGKDPKCLELLAVLNYRYLFESTEKRPLDLVNYKTFAGESLTQLNRYYLAGKKGEVGTFPLANVTTRDVDVEPGSQIDALAGLAFNWGYFTFDLGYELYAREREDVSLKGTWQEGIYAPVELDYDASQPLEITSTSANNNLGPAITKENLSTQGAETPSQVTHKIYTGVGYAFNDWKYPLMLGAGFYYEWSQNNAALEQWALSGKIGVSF